MSKPHLRLVGGKPPEPKRVTNPVGAKRWITRVLSDKALTLGDRVVAAFIGSLFNPGKGYAFPSADRMAEQIGLSQRKVFYSIKRIAERGHFEVAPGGGKGIANAYYLIETVPPSAPLQPPKDDNREPQTMNARSEFGGSNSEPPFTQTMQIDAPNSERTFTPTRRTPTVECYNGPSDMNSSLTSRDALRSKSSARDVDFFSERKKGAREMTDEQFAQRKAQMIRELEATACKTHDEYPVAKPQCPQRPPWGW
jgi:hypothetical protein